MLNGHHGCGCGGHGPVTNAKRKRRANPLRIDPTRSTTLRKRALADLRRRCVQLKRDIRQLVVVDDAFGIRANKAQGAAGAAGGGLAAALAQNATRRHAGASNGVLVANNEQWRFDTDADKVANYREWLKGQVDAGLLEVSADNKATPWLEPYIQSSYRKGAVRAYVDTNAARKAAAGTAEELSFVMGGQDEFLKMSFGGPVAQSKVEQLSTRAFSQLEGVTAQMDQEMSRVLSDGLTRGTGAEALAKELTDSVDKMEKRRARTVVRTELTHTHAEGQLDSFKQLGVDELGVMAEWNTAHDDKVCPQCQPLEGVIMTVDEARGMIPRHPNCRCAWLPAGVGEHDGGTTQTTHAGPGQGLSAPGTKPTGKTTGQQWSNDTVAQRINKSVKAEKPNLPVGEAKKASTWVGAKHTKATISGKLKPGSKAWHAAQAAAARSKAAKLAQRKLAAQAAKREAALRASKQAKEAVAVEKWGLGPEDTFKTGTGNTTATKGWLDNYAAGKLGDTPPGWAKDVNKAAHKAALERPTVPYIVHQLETADTMLADLAAKAAREAAAKAKAAERAAKLAQSKKVQAGMAKKKYGVTDDMLNPMGTGFKDPATMSAWSLARHGVDLDKADMAKWGKAVLRQADPKVPAIKTHLEVLDQIAAAKAATKPDLVSKAFASKQAKDLLADPKLAHSHKVKVGMAKKKYGLQEADLYGSGVVQLDKVYSVGMRRGVYLTPDEIKAVRYAVPDSPSTPLLLGQLDAIDAIRAKHAAAKPSKAAQAVHTTKTEDGVAAWADLPGVDTPDVLDAADYSHLPGWTKPPKGKSQSYGILLLDDQGRILMREPKGHFGGAKWTFAKGGGKAPGSTAMAELAEETGHKAVVHDVLPDGFEGTTTKTNYFLGKSKGVDKSLMDAETADLKWMSYEEAKEAIASSGGKVAARDLAVLEAAYKRVHDWKDGAAFKQVLDSGKASIDAAKAAADKAAHGHKVKVGMAKKHYAKDKFGGGVTADDLVVEDGKTKLNLGGLDKVLSEKGWSLASLSKTPDGVKLAADMISVDDIVAQKAILDGLKKAPKGTPPPAITAAPVDDFGVVDDVVPRTVPTPAPAQAPVVPNVGELTKVKDLPGSTRPWLGKDRGGKQWVVKDVAGSGINPDHLRSEALADEIYRRLGIGTNNGGVVDTPRGPAKVTEFFEGGQTLQDWQRGKSAADVQAMYKQLQEGFVADALLANHDVAGLSMDNIFVVAGRGLRIDNGGALTYRAQGAKKAGWGKEVKELASMRDPNINANTAKIYSGITDEEINRQILHIVDNKDAVLAAVDDVATRAVLADRIDWLQDQLPKTARKPAAPAPKGKRKAAYGNSPQVAARTKAAKSNGVNIAGDKDLIEDNNLLAWEEIGLQGQAVTRVQLKVTRKGSDTIIDALGEEMARARASAAASRPASNVHPDDTYWATIEKGAKTIGAHAKDGAYNTTTIAALENAHSTIKASIPTAKGDKLAMLQHHNDSIEFLLKHKAAQTAPNKGDVKPYIYTPPKDPVAKPKPRGDFRVRKDSGINFRTVDFKDGTGTNNGGVNAFSSEAYVVDAGDGIEMQFLPNDGSYQRRSGRALHGTVNVTVPEGVSEASIGKALRVLDSLGVDTTPPTAAYEEALYLHRGVYQQKQHNRAGYKAIWEADMPPEEKVPAMKAWIKKELGVDVDKVAHYDPHGVSKHVDGSGFRHWWRWDITPDQMEKEMGDYVVYHTTGSLSDSPRGRVEGMVRGVLPSAGEFTTTSGRIRKGVSINSTGGASSSADIETGGASYFFTRIKKSSNANGFYFKPSVLMRQDAIGYNSDRFGAIADIGDRATGIADMKRHAQRGGNETIFKEGFGLDDIEFIKVRPDEVSGVVDAFHSNGVTHLPDGRKITDIVVTSTPRKRVFK